MASANRIVKEKKVEAYNQKFGTAKAAVIAEYKGVSVDDVTKFRADLRSKNIELKIIKNTLAKLAIKGTSMESLDREFVGPTAIAYTTEDAVELAKTVYTFSTEQKGFSIRAGVLDGAFLDGNQVEALAKLPSREVLLARMVGSLQSPYAGLVYGLSGILRKFVYALDAVRRKKEEESKS